ncbi:MAG: 50S ribosomal protein L5 [Candidatus Pacebacteria bacterium]|nr:50S ribosomal protein L5 [Candidatus Paceibacterota bacterium]
MDKIRSEILNNLEKVVVNSGLGKISSSGTDFEGKILPGIITDFKSITGQNPSTRTAKISISGFKLREGSIIGLMSTLRGQRMADFLMKLNNVVFPRIRDFRGINRTSVDSSGNLSIGIRETIAFPEINSDVQRNNFGLEITLTLKDMTKKEEALAFYTKIGIPFKK